jgi:hypothetical protein
MDKANHTSFYSIQRIGVVVDFRYFTEITPSIGVDLGILMLHQGSEFDSMEGTITLQPRKGRAVRAQRLVRDASGSIRPVSKTSRVKPGRLIKFDAEPHGFSLDNLKPYGTPLKSPLLIAETTEWADMRAQHALQKKQASMHKAMERMGMVESTEQVDDATEDLGLAQPLGNGLWACRQDGGWLLIDEGARFEPKMFESREALDAGVTELRAD